MKKIYSFVLCVSLSLNFAFAGAGCVPDVNNTAFLSPAPDSIPCVERDSFYSQVLQIYVPVSIDLQTIIPAIPFPFIMTIDSIVIDSVTGLPNGINYYLNPIGGHFLGGTHNCALVQGVTSDPTGNYPAIFHGTITMHGAVIPGIFDGDTTVGLDVLQAAPQNPFSLSVDIINGGEECRPAASGISDFKNALNALMYVFPNPNNGNFEFRLNAGRRTTGEIVVTDLAGRKIFSQQLDVIGWYATSIHLGNLAKGLYTVQLRTAEGFASKNISIE